MVLGLFQARRREDHDLIVGLLDAFAANFTRSAYIIINRFGKRITQSDDFDVKDTEFVQLVLAYHAPRAMPIPYYVALPTV